MQILDNAQGIIAIELIAAVQAVDFREFSLGKGTRAVHGAVRKIVEHLDIDRPLFRDRKSVTQAVKRCDVLHAVEGAVGNKVADIARQIPSHECWFFDLVLTCSSLLYGASSAGCV